MHAQKSHEAGHVWSVSYPLDILKYPEDNGWHTMSAKLRIGGIGWHTISAICGEDMEISMDIEDVAAVYSRVFKIACWTPIRPGWGRLLSPNPKAHCILNSNERRSSLTDIAILHISSNESRRWPYNSSAEWAIASERNTKLCKNASSGSAIPISRRKSDRGRPKWKQIQLTQWLVKDFRALGRVGTHVS